LPLVPRRDVGAFPLEVAPPPGRELFRFATVNDVHIGEAVFGRPNRYREPDGVEPYPARCLRAALREAKAWGAQRIIAKGDLTDEGLEEEFEWFAALVHDAVGDEFARSSFDVILGNHDVRGDADGAALLRARGLHVATATEAVDVPGLRIVLLPSAYETEPHKGRWSPDDRAAALGLAADAHRRGTPVFVATHHYPHRVPFQYEHPPGVPWHQARPFLNELDRIAPGSIVACGHTHRHHRRHHRSLLLTEIGSTKDYPGVWAGYTVYEGGITQVPYPIAEPSAREWIDRTGATLFGLWQWWSPGLTSHRVWSWEWPRPT
jgi:predicted phosphodiesterase